MPLAIDEIMLIRSMEDLEQKLQSEAAEMKNLECKRYLRNEMRFLKKRLRSVREKASPSAILVKT